MPVDSTFEPKFSVRELRHNDAISGKKNERMNRMRKPIYTLAFSIMLALYGHNGTAEAKSTAIVAGYIANASLPGLGTGPNSGRSIRLKAKLDTGADTSSINAPNNERFLRNGKPWVRFKIRDGNGIAVTIEKEIIRIVRVKRSETVTSARPVIRLTLCVAGITGETEFTLADRRHLDYQLLIGRKFLQGRILVDSAQKLMHPDSCKL